MARPLRSAPAAPELAIPDGLTRDRFDAMGTQVTVLLPHARAAAGFPAIRSLFEEWEDALSRFRPHSELSFVNLHAGRATSVTPLFFTVLETALNAARATDGLYDPTLLNQLVAAGYDRTFSELPAMRPPTEDDVHPGGAWRRISLDRSAHTVTIPSDVALDFGGIAKGMAVDAAIDRLSLLGAECAAVEAGGDLRVVGHPPGRIGWGIAVEAPNRPEMVTIRSGALATSTADRRRWMIGDSPQHHLIDPRSGCPATSDLRSATVVAATCVQADVAAKTAFVLGADEAVRFLDKHQLAALLIGTDGDRRRVGPWLAEVPR